MIRKFILKVCIIIVLPCAVFFTVHEMMCRAIPNSYSLKNRFLSDSAQNIKVLILGSSHSYFGINPRYFDLYSFNAANVSQSFDYDKAILNKFWGKMPNLRYLIIPVSVFSPYTNLSGGIESWRERKYKAYYHIYRGILDFSKNDFETEIGSRMCYEYYCLHQDFSHCSHLGFGEAYEVNDNKDLEKSGVVAAKRHSVDIENSKDIYEENVKHIEEIVDLARTNHVKVIFITTPAWQSYRFGVSKAQYEGMIRFTDTFVRLDPANIVYLNMFSDSRFTEEDFFDADHMCGKGAEKLSKILNDTIPKIFPAPKL